MNIKKKETIMSDIDIVERLGRTNWPLSDKSNKVLQSDFTKHIRHKHYHLLTHKKVARDAFIAAFICQQKRIDDLVSRLENLSFVENLISDDRT